MEGNAGVRQCPRCEGEVRDLDAHSDAELASLARQQETYGAEKLRLREDGTVSVGKCRNAKARRRAAALGVGTLALTACAVYWYLPPPLHSGPGYRIKRTGSEASFVASAAFIWKLEHEVGCPTLAELEADGVIGRPARDFWDRPYRIECDTIRVSSAGPDGRFDTADDIVGM
jgi:hypothetical protein